MTKLHDYFHALTGTFHIVGSCLVQATLQPRTPISHCSVPLRDAQSPVPWWGAGAIMVCGVVSLTLAGIFGLDALSRAGQSMTELPLIYMVGRGHQVYTENRRR